MSIIKRAREWVENAPIDKWTAGDLLSYLESKEAVSVDEVMEEAKRWDFKEIEEGYGVPRAIELINHLNNFIASKRSKEAVEDKEMSARELFAMMKDWCGRRRSPTGRLVKGERYGSFFQAEFMLDHFEGLIPKPPINTAKESGEKE